MLVTVRVLGVVGPLALAAGVWAVTSPEQALRVSAAVSSAAYGRCLGRAVMFPLSELRSCDEAGGVRWLARHVQPIPLVIG